MRGRVRVLVPLDPWRLALSLTPVELGRDRLVAVLPRPSDDARALFQGGDPYELQLEPEGEELPIPGVKARLARVADGPFGLELVFAFEEPLEVLA